MICQTCSSDNTAERRYCRDCGAALAAPCSRCGFFNGLADRYCGGCGQAIGAMESAPLPAAPEQIAMPGGYSNDDLADLMGKKRTPAAAAKASSAPPPVPDHVSQDLLDSIFDATDSD